MDNKHTEYIKSLLEDVDDKGYLKRRESTTIEVKESFSFGHLPQYSKTMASFANNRGGYIIFGIKDRPRIPIGVNREKFDNMQQERITAFLVEHFSPEIKWEIGIVKKVEKYFGYIYTYEADEKPVICKKNAGKDAIRSGEIYYRYRAQTRNIEYPEFKKIIDEFREKERKMWMKHIECIAKVGPSNIALLDLLNGSINMSRIEGTKLVMDKNLLNELKENVRFIEEGKFSETEGEPTLKIVGEIKTANADIIIPDLDPNRDYPYLQKHLAEELGIRGYDAQLLIWKYNLKGNKKYHIPIKTSKSGETHKYSKYALERLRTILENEPNKSAFLNKISNEYQNYIKKKRKKVTHAKEK